MRYGKLPLLLAASLLRVGCSSAPASPSPAPQAQAEVAPASPAEASAKLSGFWLVTVQRGGQSLDHSLHIQLTAGELVGSITGADGNSHELSKITLKGDKVSWEIGGERMAQRFEGTLKGSSMEGKIKMARSSRGGSGGWGNGKGGDPSGDGGGDTSASPPGEGQAPSGGGGGGRGRGGRGRGGRGGSSPEATWKAFKSVEPPPPEATPATPVAPKAPGDVGQVLASESFRREGCSLELPDSDGDECDVVVGGGLAGE